MQDHPLARICHGGRVLSTASMLNQNENQKVSIIVRQKLSELIITADSGYDSATNGEH